MYVTIALGLGFTECEGYCMIYQKFIKRGLDIFFSLLILIIGLVPMIIIALLVKVTSPGPILFKQERYGRDSKKFMMYKFRSMRTNAPILANQSFDTIDSYLTPFGHFIRQTSLDELPQLVNVLKGEMSFVGPRPLADTDMKVIKLRKKSGADLIKPGITGLAQINGRNQLTDEEKAGFDYEYAKNLTFRMEFMVVWRTVVSVAVREGINHQTK